MKYANLPAKQLLAVFAIFLVILSFLLYTRYASCEYVF